MKKDVKEARKKWMSIGSAVLVVVLGIYMFHDIRDANRKVYETQMAEKVTEQETVPIKAFVVRDEYYIDSDEEGTVVPLVSDGNRVARGDTVARVYKSEKDAATYAALTEAEAERDRYIDLANQTQLNAVDMEKLNSDIDSCYSKLLKTASDLDYSDLSEYITELKNKLASKQILIDGNTNFDDKISELNELIADLEAQRVSHKDVEATRSGYYISNIDGFENTVAYRDVLDLDVSQIENILGAKPVEVSGKMGKIVGSYKWYIAAVIESRFDKVVKSGKAMKINIPYYGAENVAVTIENVSDAQDGKIAVVMSCNLMSETFANLRNIDAELVINEYTGYKIPASSPRTLKAGGKTFTVAYILRGNYMSARLIDIIYTPTDKDYIIVSDKTKSDYYEEENKYKDEKRRITLSPIGLYDDVIVKGKGLAHGKSVG